MCNRNGLITIPEAGVFFYDRRRLSNHFMQSAAQQAQGRTLQEVGWDVLRRPKAFYIESVKTVGNEQPFYCLVEWNKAQVPMYKCFGRGLAFDVLYLSWKQS